jgi:ribosomal protein S18 acetylase RimI-like enzyme
MADWVCQGSGFELIVTNMRKSNSPIIKLNEKLGFTIREISPGYYSDPSEDAIVMELRLQDVTESEQC